MSANLFKEEREKMVAEQVAGRGVKNIPVLNVMRKIPRHLFVPEEEQDSAYGDFPVAIGYQQTISQPYIVGYMTALLDLRRTDRVLEIGAGSGYQAAVLAELSKEVYSVETVKPLADLARKRLHELGYENVHVRHADGFKGWPEKAPFDAVIVTAAPPEVPKALVDQLKDRGRMVIPVGTDRQTMRLITKTSKGVQEEELIQVRFVPMVKE